MPNLILVVRKLNGNFSKVKNIVICYNMSILITSIIAGTSALIGSIVGFCIGDKRGRRLESEKNYDELIRYYETEHNSNIDEENIVM